MVLTSLYVHEDLLEWFENYLVERVAPEHNLIVEEICHHKFDDNIKHIVSDRSAEDEDLLMDCLLRSTYQMFWLAEATYFIEINEYVEVVVNDLETQLKQLSLMQYLRNRYEKEVNWLTIKEILVFEFEQNLDDATFRAIDNIFLNNIAPERKPPSLFLAQVLPWHDAHEDYIEVDTLAIDICGEEWIRHNLLQDLNLEDLLCVELANKDFRNSYYDQYLDKYLQRCVVKKLPFNFDVEDKIEFPLPNFDYKEINGYFIYKYHKHISTLYTSDAGYKRDVDYVTKILKIPKFQYLEDRLISLNKNDINIEEIIKLCKPVQTAIYEISPNFNFSNDLFIQLLKLPNVRQIYSFNLSDQITFQVPIFVEKISWLAASVQINMYYSGAQNSTKLKNLVQYCIQVFQDVAETVSYRFDSCILPDFEMFKNVGSSTIILIAVQIEHAQLLTLASYLMKDSTLVLKNCETIHDLNILELVKQSKISPTNLNIKGQSSCTFLVNFMIAEHLIRHQNRSKLSILNIEMPFIEKFQDFFDQMQIEYFIRDDMVLMRNYITKEHVDAYNLLNRIVDDEEPPFDYE